MKCGESSMGLMQATCLTKATFGKGGGGGDNEIIFVVAITNLL